MTPSLRDLGRAFRDGSLAPETHARDCLAAIARRNPTLGCYVRVDAEAALAEARRAAADFAAGIDRGPLQGIPYAIADVIDVAGEPTTCGSRLMAGHVAHATAEVVARLRTAGAVLLGKTAVFEFAVGSPGEDSLLPPARNPSDPARIAGAVGGGAAVAAGLAAFAIAPDTGGAVRGSAALCGVAGLKPTMNLVSCDGVFPAARSLDHVGVIAASADDIAIVLPVVAQDRRGPSHGRLAHVPAKWTPVRRQEHAPIKESRACSDSKGTEHALVGVLSGQPGLHPAVLGALERAAAAFAAMGARIEPISVDYFEQLLAAAQVIYAAECFAIHRDALRRHADRFGRNTRHRVVVGAFLDPADVARAREVADRLVRRFEDEVMSSCDILLCPAAAGPAPRLDTSAYGVAGRSGAQTLPFNLTGHPAISVPYGHCDGLPLGLQLVGRHFDEAVLLSAAAALTAHDAATERMNA